MMRYTRRRHEQELRAVRDPDLEQADPDQGSGPAPPLHSVQQGKMSVWFFFFVFSQTAVSCVPPSQQLIEGSLLVPSLSCVSVGCCFINFYGIFFFASYTRMEREDARVCCSSSLSPPLCWFVLPSFSPRLSLVCRPVLAVVFENLSSLSLRHVRCHKLCSVGVFDPSSVLLKQRMKCSPESSKRNCPSAGPGTFVTRRCSTTRSSSAGLSSALRRRGSCRSRYDPKDTRRWWA